MPFFYAPTSRFLEHYRLVQCYRSLSSVFSKQFSLQNPNQNIISVKKYLISLFLSCFYFPVFTQNLTIEIKNINFKQGGTIFLMVVDKNDNPIQKITRPLAEKNNVFNLKDLGTPVCAVRVFHDKNNNGKIDTGIFGQPLEGWGVSNDARGFMSAPPFNKMLLTLSGETKAVIRLDY
jgi:uncharacterized protein (DUF2141 family)